MPARFQPGDRMKDAMVAKITTRNQWAYDFLGGGQVAGEYVNPYVFAVVDPGQGNNPAIYDVIIPYSAADDATDGWMVRVSETEFR